MDSLKKAVTSLKDRIVKSPLERSILEACSDENWGSSNSTFHELSEKTFNHEDRITIMKMVWDLLKSPSKEWRRLYKVLNLIESILKFGSTACLHEFQDEVYKIRMLQDFNFKEGSEERGIGIRDKAKYLNSLLTDNRVLEEEKDKARKTWGKFKGISSDNVFQRYDDSSWSRSSYDPYVPKSVIKDESSSYSREEPPIVKEVEKTPDIFKVPEVKPVVSEPKASIWDKEPGKLPPPPKGGRVGVPAQQVFETPQIKVKSEAGGGLINESSPNNFRSMPAFPQPDKVGFEGLSLGGQLHRNGGNNIEGAIGGQPTNVYNVPNSGSLFSNPSGGYQEGPNPYRQTGNVLPQLPNTFPQPSHNYSQPTSTYNQPPNIYHQPSNLISGVPNSYPQNSSIFPQPANTSSQHVNVFPQPHNSYIQPPNAFSPNYPPYPQSGYSMPPNTNFMPANNYNSPPGPSHYSSQPPPQNKVHSNIGGCEGTTIEQLKTLGKSGFSNFQSAPIPAKQPVDLESKLINLDDLQSGQPRAKEALKSRW